MDMESRKEVYDPISDKKLKFNKTSTFFFLNGELHRLVRKSAAQNIVYAFNFHKDEIVKYTYKDYKTFKRKAYKISEVGKILNRHIDRIRVAMASGNIKKPFLVSYKARTGVYYFSEEDIYAYREYFAGLHRGRPRADGIIIPKRVPTEAEVDAILGRKPVLYVKTKEGNYVPVWRQEEYE